MPKTRASDRQGERSTTPTWTELALRAAGVVRVWYRHSVRRWWRRHITTRRLRPRKIEIFGKTGTILVQPPGTPIEVTMHPGCNPYDAVISSRAAVAHWTAIGQTIGGPGGSMVAAVLGAASASLAEAAYTRAKHEQLQQLAMERARRTYTQMSDAMDFRAGLMTIPLPRPNDEPT